MEKYISVLESILKKEGKISSGLYSGGMGVCLSLYMINKSVNHVETEELADMLLEKTTLSIKDMKETSFGTGLTGIGWAINFLHMNKCIEGDIDDILYNIDAAIYRILCKQQMKVNVDFEDGLIGYLVYMVYRLKNKNRTTKGIQNQINEAALRIIVDLLEIKMPSRFHMLSKDLLSTILWEYPILFYCLGEAIKLRLYKEKIESMMANWSYTIMGYLPFSNINRLALANSLAYINGEIKNKHIRHYVDVLFYSVDFADYVQEIGKKNISISGEWFYALINVSIAQKLMNPKHVRYSDLYKNQKLIYDLYNNEAVKTFSNTDMDQHNSSLINGYSGTILVYFLFQNIFNKKGNRIVL